MNVQEEEEGDGTEKWEYTDGGKRGTAPLAATLPTPLMFLGVAAKRAEQHVQLLSGDRLLLARRLSSDMCVFSVVRGERGRVVSNFSGLDILSSYAIAASQGAGDFHESNHKMNGEEEGSNQLLCALIIHIKHVQCNV